MNRKTFLVGAVLAIVAVVFGIYSSLQTQQQKKNYTKQLETATVLSTPRTVAAFSLKDNKNQVYTNKDLLGHWTVLFFGFTNCGYICPTTMAELKQMTTILDKEHIKPPQVILVSIDPKRDTVSRLNDYVTGYNSNFMGLTGSEAKLKAFAKDFYVLSIKIENKNAPEKYDIDHSGNILLINPQGQLQAIFSMPHKAKQIAHDFTLIQKYA